MTTGVIYARYSYEKQTENSILGQIRECKEFAKKNDIEIIDIYKDEAISGRTAEKRPSSMRMINDANKHCSKTLLFGEVIDFLEAELMQLSIKVN
jgi:DNA invertase Pin-like site-specific DNA recombinase